MAAGGRQGAAIPAKAEDALPQAEIQDTAAGDRQAVVILAKAEEPRPPVEIQGMAAAVDHQAVAPRAMAADALHQAVMAATLLGRAADARRHIGRLTNARQPRTAPTALAADDRRTSVPFRLRAGATRRATTIGAGARGSSCPRCS